MRPGKHSGQTERKKKYKTKIKLKEQKKSAERGVEGGDGTVRGSEETDRADSTLLRGEDETEDDWIERQKAVAEAKEEKLKKKQEKVMKKRDFGTMNSVQANEEFEGDDDDDKQVRNIPMKGSS